MIFFQQVWLKGRSQLRRRATGGLLKNVFKLRAAAEGAGRVFREIGLECSKTLC